MKGRDWLTNEKREEDEGKTRVKKRKRVSLYGKATMAEIRADYQEYSECLSERLTTYHLNIDTPYILMKFRYLDSYEGQQFVCSAWYEDYLLTYLLINSAHCQFLAFNPSTPNVAICVQL